MKKYKIKDIAEMAGVSPATVSRVMLGRPGVNPKKREEVLRIIAETGYYPDNAARSLVNGHSNIVGLLVRDLENSYYASMAVEFERELRKHGFFSMVMSVGGEGPDINPAAYLEEVNKILNFAGMFISVPSRKLIRPETVERSRCPVILLNRSFDARCDQVMQNDIMAGEKAARHLVELGHKRLAIVAGPYRQSTSCNFRLIGFRQVLSEENIPLAEKDIIICPLAMDEAYAAEKKWLQKNRNNLPTAVFVSGNSMALGFVKACKELDIRIPEDISVVTIDNPPIMDLPGIELTSVSVSMSEMAACAVDMLLKRIQNTDKKNEVVSLEPQLVVRNSTAEAPETAEEPFVIDTKKKVTMIDYME